MRHITSFIPKSEKNKAIALVALVVAALAAAFFYQGVQLHRHHIEELIHDKRTAIDETINHVDSYSFAAYEKRLHNQLILNEQLSEALFNQDRQQLYNLTLPLYLALQRENPHIHVMHYHLPDGHTFLRMHAPEKFGDDLRQIRPAIQQVHRDQKPISCYEIGIHGTFYRIIQPVFYHGH